MARQPRSLLLWLGIALVVLLADQFTKLLIIGTFSLGESQPVTSYFNWVRVHNSGAAPVGGPTTQAAFAPFGKNAGGPDGGLGIGLPLAQRILELHGGMLRLRTDTDGLTEVTIQVPTGAPHQNLQRADMEQARKYAEDLARLMATRRTTANTTTK